MTIVSSTPSRSRTVTSARGLLSLRCCAFDRQLLLDHSSATCRRPSRSKSSSQTTFNISGTCWAKWRFTASCVGTAIAEIQTEALPAGVALSWMTRHQTFLYRSLESGACGGSPGTERGPPSSAASPKPTTSQFSCSGLSLIKRCYNARNAHFARPAEHAIERPKKLTACLAARKYGLRASHRS